MLRRTFLLLLAALIPLGSISQAEAGLFSKRIPTLRERAAKDAKDAKKARSAPKAKMQKQHKRWILF